MSRICVKNLPKYANEDRLRDFFSQKGEVTDAKLVRTNDGKSRQFAFIGFRTESEAETALKFFNNAYMDTSKINCELARKIGDPNIPRPWSRYSAKKENPSTENDGDSVEEKSKSLTDSKVLGAADDMAKNFQSNEIKNPHLQEFLQVMQPRVKSKLWADDAVGNVLTDHNGKANEEYALPPGSKKKQSAKEKVQSSDECGGDDELAGGTPSSPLKGRSEPNSTKTLRKTALDDGISDMDYFKSRVKADWSDSEAAEEGPHDEGLDSIRSQTKDADAEGHTARTEHQVHVTNSQEEEKRVLSVNGSDAAENDDERTMSSKQDLDSGRLFVRNLPYTTNEDELLELFSQFGDVAEVHLVVDKDTKRSKGIAYVLYKLPECALRALEELDNSIFQGRLLHIMPAKPRKTNTEELQSGLDAPQVKKSREEQKKASEASGDTRAWNSLFMRPDTVVENIARKHGISKSDLLEREADDLAVRIALGETQVIAETKKYLATSGVNIAALEEFASRKNNTLKRSNHVILVKNLPYGSSEGDLANMFGKFGSLDKIVLPGTKALALAYPQERVGVFVQRGRGGPMTVLEYSEMDPSMASEINQITGRLRYCWSNVCFHMFTLDFLSQVANGLEKDRIYRLAEKKIPSIHGYTMGLKLEQFIFDAFAYAPSMALFEVLREEEFAPVKNANGANHDTPDTARGMLLRLHSRWVVAAGGFLTHSVPLHLTGVEISPLCTYTGENLEAICRGRTFHAPSEITF